MPRPEGQPVRVSSLMDPDSMVESDHAERLDLNRIAQNVGLDPSRVHIPVEFHQTLDATGPRDLQGALDQMEVLEERFLELPASVRAAARNSVARFEQMLHIEEGLAELQAAGLNLNLGPAESSSPSQPPASTADVPRTDAGGGPTEPSENPPDMPLSASQRP